MSVDKKINYDVQGGIRNYLGKQKTISNVPLKWKSGPGHPKTELAYITQAEKDLLIKKDLHNSLKNGPNKGPGGIISLNNDGIGDTGGPGSGGSENAGTDDKGNSMGGGTGPSVQAPPGVRSNPTAPTDGTEGTLSDPREKFDFVGNTKFGPTQKYTGGGFFSGANKYGYRDVDTNPFSKNYGDTKPGYAGRIIGGLGSLLTGIPFVGGALGTAYDYGKGIFGPKQRDMSQFNKLGLGGVNPATLDFDPNAQINQNVDTTGSSRFSNASLGKPNINNLESLIAASQGINFNNPVGGLDQFAKEVEALEATRAGEILKANQLGGTLQDFYTNKQPLPPNYSGEIIDDDINFNDGSSQGIMSTTSASDLPAEFQDMATYAGNYSQNAVSKQLYGEEYDVLDPFTQQQIDSLIDQVGTKSTGELAGREV